MQGQWDTASGRAESNPLVLWQQLKSNIMHKRTVQEIRIPSSRPTVLREGLIGSNTINTSCFDPTSMDQQNA